MASPTAIAAMMAGFQGGDGGGNTQANAYYQAQLNDYLKQKELEKQMQLAQYQHQLGLQRSQADIAAEIAKRQEERQFQQQQSSAIGNVLAKAYGQQAVPWQQDPEEAAFAPMDTSGMYAEAGSGPLGMPGLSQQQIAALQFQKDIATSGLAGLLPVVGKHAQATPSMLTPNIGDMPSNVQTAQWYFQASPEEREIFDRTSKITRDIGNAREIAEAQEIGKIGGNTVMTEIANAPNTVAILDKQVDDIENILPIIDNLYANTDKSTTGFAGIFNFIPESDPKTWKQKRETLLANLTFEKMRQLKDQSQTGATGLGQITEKEIELLRASFASLDQLQDPKAIKQNLEEISRILNKARNRMLESRYDITDFYNKNAQSIGRIPDTALKKFQDRNPYSPVRSFTQNLQQLQPTVPTAPAQQQIIDFNNW